jgi:hypothetical protein
MSYKNHLKSANDLVTTREDTCAGFIKMSLERSLRATSFVEQGRALKATTNILSDIDHLLEDKSLYPAILTAAGVSDKANQYFEEADKNFAINEFVEKYLRPSGDQFSDELTYRYLLTRGETLGGMMKNIVGYLAEVRLLRAMIATLNLKAQPFKYFDKRTEKWLTPQANEPELERYVYGLTWNVKDEPRTLLLNIKVPQVNKNVDLCLFQCSPFELFGAKRKQTLNDSGKYLALGELKGGIDPAGADEHWKTARTALNRISTALERPAIFFVGAAIAKAMSIEIWNSLENGQLANAANLTHDGQVASFAVWLVSL